MKQVLIVRHAKSDWAQMGLADFDRPLNERGKHDAPMMAQRMLGRQIEINAFISSSANRAFSTAYYFAKAYQMHKKDVIGIKQLYNAYPAVFYEVIRKLNDGLNTVAIFAHNPGITMFVNELTETKIDNMPTCGVFAIQVDSKIWKDFQSAKKTFWFFDYPKL